MVAFRCVYFGLLITLFLEKNSRKTQPDSKSNLNSSISQEPIPSSSEPPSEPFSDSSIIPGIIPAPVIPKSESVKSIKDDLTKIEGIGPKINQLLHNAGIYTFQDLAQSEYETLKSILHEAGERFRIHDPTTWPKQSHLAAEGRWDELKNLQDRLKGGREE